MKDIKNYTAKKYESDKYTTAENNIYKTNDNGSLVYVTSLSFVQEPEFGEGGSAAEISRYPLEDVLDEFFCYISDFYEELNAESSQVCYQEFASSDLEDIVNLRTIIGKHVYNKGSKLVIE